jgi:CheY-like chemotaxis protein
MFKDHVFLYVEDDPLSREALEAIFTRVMGVDQLYIFDDSTDFISRVKALPAVPDLFLIDIHLKPYNGFELLDMLRSDPMFQQAKVIALTASVMNEEVDLLKKSGFDGAIGKPISVVLFPELIERILRNEAVWHVSE